MNPIKIAVCDDEPYIRSYLVSLIQKQNYETEITEYASAAAYLSDAAEYDLLFLDIELDNSCPEHKPTSSGPAGSSMEYTVPHGGLAGSSTECSVPHDGLVGSSAECPMPHGGLAGSSMECPVPHDGLVGSSAECPMPHGGLAGSSTECSAPHDRLPDSSAECTVPHGGLTGSSTENRINGIELARRIRAAEGCLQPLIIFVTGYESYVYDAFDVDAFQYLLKPVDEQKFAEVFQRAAERITAQTQQQKKLVIQYAGTSRVLPLSKIYYMESQGHKIVLHLKDETLKYYAKLGELEQALQGQFCRIHKGFLVNLAHVEGYSKTEVTLANGDRLNLSKYKYDDFVKAHLRFIRSSA